MTTLIWPTAAAALQHARHTAKAPLAWDPAGHLLSRFSFGPTPSTRAWVHRHGVDAYLSSQISFARRYPGYGAHKQVAALGPLLGKSPYDVRMWLKANGGEYGWTAMDQLTQVTIGLQTWSAAQLYETLVDFFSNHLNVANHFGDVWNTRHAYDREVIRRYAMGSFGDMLLASARHPAMLIYLNLADSTKTAINENYGRELLELHTVGRRYSESDVKNAAKLLTGRTIDDYQHYVYDGYIHATGAVKVLGFQHSNRSEDGGEAAGDQLIRYLASHPYTAANLARKMCVRFVSDNPSQALVNAVASAYLRNETSILAMVSTIVRSTEFWASRGLKVRRPAENLIATVRAVGPAVTDFGQATQGMHWMTSSMDNVPLDWPAPNGYPDIATAWRSSGSMVDAWNYHFGVVGGWFRDKSGKGMQPVDVTKFFTGAATSGQAINMLTNRLTGMTFSKAHQAALQEFLGEPASTPLAKSTLRWMSTPLAATILHGPHHALR